MVLRNFVEPNISEMKPSWIYGTDNLGPGRYANLKERHFKEILAADWLIEGFMAGYGNLDDATAFRTAIQVGAHLICWGSRSSKGTPEQTEAAMRIGKDFVVRGWEKDKSFFDGTVLRCLFS